MFDFDKGVFVDTVTESMELQGITKDELSEALGIGRRSLDNYLNKDAKELPKIPLLVKMVGHLNTSLARILVGRGPLYIDPKSNRTIYGLLEKLLDIEQPAYRAAVNMLVSLPHEDVEHIIEHLELYVARKQRQGDN